MPKHMKDKGDTTISVKSFDEWFALMKATIVNVEAYESLVRKYYLRRGESELWGRPHKQAFWKDDRPFTRISALFIVKCAFAGLILSLIAQAVFAVQVTRELEVTSFVIAGGIGIVAGIIIGALGVIVRRVALTHKLARLERKLAGPLSLIAPRYRNVFCLRDFVDAHDVYMVNDYDAAARAVEKHIERNARAYKPIAALVDVPFDAHVLVAVADKNRNRSKSDPALPSDIEQHTHAGALNWRAELDNLIGLGTVKEQVAKLQARMKVYGGTSVIGGNNMVFMGPAGTGKTSIARVMTGMLADAGYINENRIVEVDGGYLKSPHVGETGKRVSAVCRWAEGGVLFIDEAYLLLDPNSSVGAEATGVLLKELEDRAQHIVVILAGYTDQMERLIASNEGFRSRMRHTLRFEPYSASELAEICRRMLDAMNIKLDTDAMPALTAEFARELKTPGFGGAREARNCADALIEYRAQHIAAHGGDAVRISKNEVVAWVGERMREMSDVRHDYLATMGIDENIVSVTELESRTRTIKASTETILKSMVGQDAAKKELAAWAAKAKMMGEAAGASHVALIGGAGVGKTKFAEAVVAALYECGRIEKPQMVDITGDWLRAPYVGQTGKRTEAAIQWSRGGVLFIDEAYLLSDSGNASFGAEALGVLVNDMEKYDDLVVVMAGYADAMNDLFTQNEGLSSRITTKIRMGTYTVRELMLILQRMARAKRFKLNADVYKAAQPGVERAMRREGFGWARSMRMLLEAMIDAHALRWDADTSIDPNIIEAEDAHAAVEKLEW